MLFESEGKVVDKIKVHLHHRILDLFSANLYSSPNKAFEELVCNSYDARADTVCVWVPPDVKAKGAVMWVCDNGTGMDGDGLKALWKVGYSAKRDGVPDAGRLQIGKFGIGKLATYVLARKLTHICKRNGKILAVTMDYGSLIQNEGADANVELPERELSEEEAIKVLKPILEPPGRRLLQFDLWGAKAAATWTVAIMSDFTPKAEAIKEGRLKWVLSTALPLSPRFNLYYNGAKLESSKLDVQPLKTWVIGENDKIVKDNGEYVASTYEGQPSVNLPNLHNIRGFVELYEDSLVKGKSQELGRSHGVFLMIRKRLVNIDDPLLGSMAELHHATFNRMRLVVHADELDSNLTSGRESIMASTAFSELQTYIQKKFNEVRSYLANYWKEDEKKSTASYKFSKVPSSLSRRPLLVIARKYLNGEIEEPSLTKMPSNLNPQQKSDLIATLEEELLSEGGIIKDIEMGDLTSQGPIAQFDLVSRKVTINLMHPFIATFYHDINSSALPFKVLATNEILTEAFMIELGVEQSRIKQIMHRRDQVLREVIYSETLSAPQVAMLLKDSVADPDGLEMAVFQAFRNLGFDTIKIGGNGKPDGKASACLRVTGVRKDFCLTYDTKSTGKDRVKAATVNAGGIARHRNDYKADYCVVVAVDFEGATDPESAVNKEARANEITLFRAIDLQKLVLLAAPKQINLKDIKEMLESCKTVIETTAWVEKLSNKVVDKKPIKILLETIAGLSISDDEVPSIYAIRVKNKELEKYTVGQLVDFVRSLQSIAPHLISISDDSNPIVSIQSTPEKIFEYLDLIVNDVPSELAQMYVTAFEKGS